MNVSPKLIDFEEHQIGRQKNGHSPVALANGRAPINQGINQHGFRWLWDVPSSGKLIKEDAALELDTVFACVNVLSQAIASLPLCLFRITRSRSGVERRDQARNHPLNRIVKKRPHHEFTSFRWRQHMMVQLLVRGNSITQILRDRAGKIIGLYPLIWEHATMKRRENGALVYEYRPISTNRNPVVLDADEVLHIRGISNTGGLIGMSVIQAQREAIGLARVAEIHGGKTFLNGARPGGVLEVPETLSDVAYARLRESWADTQQGVENAARTAVLEEGTKFNAVSMTNEDAEFLATRKYQRSQIAAFFRVPAHMINDLERATFSNIEHQDLGFVKHSLLPWLVNIEQELEAALLTDSEGIRFYFRHNVSGLERADFATRTDGLQKMINAAIMTPNEARAKEEMNPHPSGDILLGNGSLMPIAGREIQPNQAPNE